MNTFTDYDILLIRACKKNKTSIRSMRRIIGMKCALPLQYVTKQDVIHFLIEIVIDFKLIRSWDEFLVVELNPKKDYWYISEERRPKEQSYIDNLTDALISKIRLTEVKIFPRWRSTRYHRILNPEEP